jgi:hypothetical protein
MTRTCEIARLTSALNSRNRDTFAVATCQAYIAWHHEKQTSDWKFSNHARIAELRHHFFADVDALQKTGRVQLPPLYQT